MMDKELCVQGQGSYDFRSDNKPGLRMVKWWDNKGVMLGSSFAGLGALRIKKGEMGN